MEEEHDSHDGVCHDMTTHENHDEYTSEDDCVAAGHMWMEEEHDDHDDEMTAEEALSMFDTDGDNNLSWDEIWVAWNTEDDDDHDGHDHGDEHSDDSSTAGQACTVTTDCSGDETCESGVCVDDDHDDASGDGDGDHDHDDDHSPLDEVMEQYMMDLLMPMFNESDVDNSGGLSLEELEHFIEDIDAMEDSNSDVPSGQFIVAAFDEDGDSALSFEEFSEMMGMEHDDHADDETHDEDESSEEEFIELMMQMMFDMYDMNSDDSLNASEVDMMFEMMDLEDDHHEEGVAFIGLHVEEEGDYGIALPAGVSLHVLMEGGHEGHGHDGHDDHGDEDRDHDDHDGHGDEDRDHDDHDGHGDEDRDHDDHDGHGDADSADGGDSTIVADEEEEFEYDPHSWLDPMSFKAQTELVLNALIEVFPNGTDTFTANAEAFMTELDKVHVGYLGAFGPEGTCTNKTAAANHNAYSYITVRYGVEFVTVHGLDPEGQPSVEDIENVISKIKEDEIGVLFIEEYTQASSVDLIVDETGVEVMYLYTMEKSPSDANDDYISMLNKNLDNLKTGLGCAV